MPAGELRDDDPQAYVRLALLVRKQIADGDLEGGCPVSITTLSREHGHTRQTCSKALGLLVGDGLLFRVPGLGYDVPGDAAERLARK